MIFFALIIGSATRCSGKIYPIAGLLLFSLSAAHSLIDFSLQIPGLTIVIFAVVSVGIAQSIVARDPTVKPRSLAENNQK
jgi:hypothetical protein